MTAREYKEMSLKEFSRAATVYETDRAGVYKMCKKDYPDVLAELEKEDFNDLLDCGCGTAPMLSLLKEKYPDRHYTGIDLTPKMIEVAKAKKMQGVELVVGDCEKLPFAAESFDVVICCQSFHHYPNVQDFHVYGKDEVQDLCSRAGLKMELFEERGLFRLHCVARKPA